MASPHTRDKRTSRTRKAREAQNLIGGGESPYPRAGHTAKLNATFTISCPAEGALADQLNKLRSGDRSRWIRERVNGYELFKLEATQLKVDLAHQEKLARRWAQLYYDQQHMMGLHAEKCLPCEACQALESAFEEVRR